jgi:hypothetical protein
MKEQRGRNKRNCDSKPSLHLMLEGNSMGEI